MGLIGPALFIAAYLLCCGRAGASDQRLVYPGSPNRATRWSLQVFRWVGIRWSKCILSPIGFSV